MIINKYMTNGQPTGNQKKMPGIYLYLRYQMQSTDSTHSPSFIARGLPVHFPPFP